jgi:hypothetical protein
MNGMYFNQMKQYITNLNSIGVNNATDVTSLLTVVVTAIAPVAVEETAL